MRNLSKLLSYMSVKPRELALITICNTTGPAHGTGPIYRGVGPTYAFILASYKTVNRRLLRVISLNI